MSIGKLERNLLQELDARLAPAGFRRVRINDFYGDSYIREASGVRHTLGIGMRPYVDALEASVGSVSVRFNGLEDLVARLEDAHPLVGPDDIAARSTLTVQVSTSKLQPGDPLHRWGGDDRKIWLIHAVGDIPDVAAQMTAYAVQKCEPAFAELSDMEHALSLLSGDDELSRSHSGPDEARAKRAITLAFMLHGEAHAMQLARTKLGRLKRQDRPALEKWMGRFFEESKRKSA